MLKNINYKLVDTAGQITAVVFGAYEEKLLVSISNQIMNSNSLVEQVVFIEQKDGIPLLKMMGGELSINGTLAGAYIINYFAIKVDALNQIILFDRKVNTISAKFPTEIVEFLENDFVKLKGIGYKISNNEKLVSKSNLKKLCDKYNLPAVGIITYKKNKISPIVYVAQTNTLMAENACGSGSLSFSIFSGYSEIIQPSNQTITVKKAYRYFTIKVPVKIVK